MCASLLTDETLCLHNAPALADTHTMMYLLNHLGVQTQYHERQKTVELNAHRLTTEKAPYDIVRKMRASILVLGPLLARYGCAHVSLPGGCAIGLRPVNLHMEALQALGADIKLEDGYIFAKIGPKGLVGGAYSFPVVSVTGTANLLMAATLAKGETIIENAACEPEVGNLAKCLCAMGAQIEGIGTRTLRITGVNRLRGATHTTLPDRIETGTYILAAAITGGELLLKGGDLSLLPTFTDTLKRMGLAPRATKDGIHIKAPPPHTLKGIDVITGPYPDFPTDLQAQMMALLTVARGKSVVRETIFENRLMHVAELMRMGAQINIHDHAVHIEGQESLSGAALMATDLRASACLVLAALAASGESLIQRIYHLDRGYVHMERKLAACGAHIKRLSEDENPIAQTCHH
jgi:UDP-N-acetylglucosamine 1-carboxyvinyltransferase